MGWRLGIENSPPPGFMKKAQRLINKSKRLFEDRVSVVVMSLMILAMIAALWFLVSQKSATPAIADYQGTVVDRWADYAESSEGSRPRLALVVESSDGKRFTVRVEPAIYETARVGRRIKSKSGQIVLIDSDRSR